MLDAATYVKNAERARKIRMFQIEAMMGDCESPYWRTRRVGVYGDTLMQMEYRELLEAEMHPALHALRI